MQAVHGYPLGDVYEWAGELRTVDAVKGGSLFRPPADIEAMSAIVFGRLADQDYLRGRSRPEFVDGLATTLTAVNILHPFREGNARAMRAWSEQLAAQAGHIVVWQRLGRAEQTEVFTAAFQLDPEPLRRALDKAVVATLRGRPVDTEAPTGLCGAVAVNRARGQWGSPPLLSPDVAGGTFGAVSDAVPPPTPVPDVYYGAER